MITIHCKHTNLKRTPLTRVVAALCMAFVLGCSGSQSKPRVEPQAKAAVEPQAKAAVEPQVDYSLLSAEELLNHAKKADIAITVSDDCSISLYPPDANRKLGAALINKSDDIARLVDQEKWLSKHILGTWKCEKAEETSFGTFRRDGIVEVTREHNNIVLGALNSMINGKKINYRWAVSGNKLHTKIDSSETGNLDKLHFLARAEQATITVVDKDHLKVEGPNAIGGFRDVDWYRVGR